MKALELAKLLLQHPEFEVELIYADTSSCSAIFPQPLYETLKISGIADIGHSSKVIVLDYE